MLEDLVGGPAQPADAQDRKLVEELPFWAALRSSPSLSLVDGTLDAARDTVATAGHVTLTLPGATALLGRAARRVAIRRTP